MNNGWNKNDFTVGKVAEIIGVPAKMLRYWDRIGLLKPQATDLINGYRYYSSSQFYLLNFIKYLKKLDVPYETIKTHLHDTDIRALSELLREQVQVTENRIRDLTMIRETFLSNISSIEEALLMPDLDTVTVQSLPERRFIRLDHPIPTRLEFEVCIGKLERLIEGTPTLLVTQVALTIGREAALGKNFDTFSGACVPLGNHRTQERHVCVLPEGEYAVIRFWGNIKTSEPFYSKLIDHIEANGYELSGELLRRCVAPGTIKGKHAHLAEVTAPVIRKA